MTDLQAWVGHLFIVGGRAVRTPPPGALAESAPRRAPRIREGDMFFILVTPSGDLRASAAYFEELAQVGADTYFGSTGGITSGLREALNAIDHHAIAQPVNVLAVVQRGSDVYAARGGQTFAALSQDDTITFFPDDRLDPLGGHLPPLGAGSTPEMQLAHYTVAPGHALLLAGPHLMNTHDDALRSALGGSDIQAVLDTLKAVAGPMASASVIRFVGSGTFDPAGIAPQPGTRAVRASMARFSKPAVVPETPDDVLREPLSESHPESPPALPAVDVPPRPRPESHAQPASFTAPEPTAPVLVDTPPVPPAIETEPSVSPPAGSQNAAPLSTASLPAPVEMQTASFDDAEDITPSNEPAPRRIPALKQNMWRAPSPDAPRLSPLQQIGIGIKRAGRDLVRSILAGLLAVIDAVARLVNVIVPAPSTAGKQGIPTNVAIGLVLLIPLVIVVVVVGLALSEQGKSEFEVYLSRAQSAHQEALALSAGKCDSETIRLVWVEVLRLAEQAEGFRPNDMNTSIIRADARNYLDLCDGVQRRDLVPLREYERGAELVGPVVNGGIDLFTLDRTHSRIYHDTLNERGDGIAASDKDPIIWKGQTISSASGIYTIGDLVDIQWLSGGGTAHDNVLIALDRSGLLISYSMTFLEAAQHLIVTGWENPVALAVFRSNIYVLDSGANQIWRYVQPAGERAYSNAPEEYFNGAELPDLSTAVDFGISDEGAIYILFADGTVKKYRRNVDDTAEEQPFFYRERPPGAITSGKALFVDNDPASASLFIIDSANETVYSTSWSGRFGGGFRPGNLPEAFDQVSGLYADAVSRNNMYVLAGNKLYHFKRN